MAAGKLTNATPRHRRARSAARARRAYARSRPPMIAPALLTARFDEPERHWTLGVRASVIFGLSGLLWFAIYKLFF